MSNPIAGPASQDVISHIRCPPAPEAAGAEASNDRGAMPLGRVADPLCVLTTARMSGPRQSCLINVTVPEDIAPPSPFAGIDSIEEDIPIAIIALTSLRLVTSWGLYFQGKRKAAKSPFAND